MSTTQSWWKRFLAPSPEIRRGPHTVTTGIVRVGSNLELCPVDDKRRGVKLVTMPFEQYRRFEQVLIEYAMLQDELRALPKSRRARKRKMKIVSLPPNPEQDHMDAAWDEERGDIDYENRALLNRGRDDD